MTFWEGFALASSVWLFLCVVGVYLGYYAGCDQNITRWSDGFTEGYNTCMEDQQWEKEHNQQLEASYSQVSKALCGKENATLEEVLQAVEQVKQTKPGEKLICQITIPTADALLKAIEEVELDGKTLAEWLELVKGYKQLEAELAAAKRERDAAVFADYAPVKHSEWVKDGGGFIICKECGCSPADWEAKPDNPSGHPPYCHSCGAKMEVQ